MFDETTIRQLKQSNISISREKTMQHTKEVWKMAKPREKKAVIALAGVSMNTVYRVINTGSISAKLAVAVGQTLNVDPFYLTGEAEEHGECSGTLLRELLLKHGYENVLEQQDKAVRRANRIVKRRGEYQPYEDGAQFDEYESEVYGQISSAASEQRDISDEEIMAMIKALRIKAGLGIVSADNAVKRIYDILLS